MTFDVPDDELLDRAVWGVLVKLRAGWRCEDCGRQPLERGALHAHHVDIDATNNRLSNGRVLCSTCHGQAHSQERVDLVRAEAHAAKRGRGRPRIDRLMLAEEVAGLLAEEPGLTASEVAARVRGRRSDVLRLVRVLRTVQESSSPAVPSQN